MCLKSRYIQYFCFLLILFVGTFTTATAQVDSVRSTLPELKIPKLRSFENVGASNVALTTDSSMVVARSIRVRKRLDSATLARMSFVTDSILKKVVYPLEYISLTALLDSVEKQILVKGHLNLLTYFNNKKKVLPVNTYYKAGRPLSKGLVWLPLTIMMLLVFFVVLRQYHSKQLYIILKAFYSNHWLNILGKDNNLMNSWLFLLMFLFFGFNIGSFLCLTSRYFRLSYPIDGLALWLAISAVIIVFLAIKLLIVTIIGFVFDVSKVVSEYVSIQYLMYFNISILFLPLLLFFCFSPVSYGKYYVYIGAFIIAMVLITQILRAVVNILSQFKLGKFYLLLYICALEICPVLIIIKALAY